MIKWKRTTLDDVLKYEQPTKYIVNSDRYNDEYETPVLTAGKSFLLGYTDEKDNIFDNLPVIIFDDFTTAFKYVDFPFKVKSSAMKILKAVENIADIKFLYYNMQLIKIDNERHKRYWISKYSQFKIPLPPLDTQKKIAAILDEADKLRRLDEQIIKKYDALVQSLFLDMFGDFVLNPYGFVQSTLGELLPEKNSIKCGPFGSQLKIGEYIEEGIPVYGIDNVAVNKFKDAKPKFISEKKFKQLKAFDVSCKDILISRTGTVGRTCLAPNVDNAVIGPNLLKVRIQNDKLLPIFLSFAFNYSPSIIKQIEMFSPGATVAVYNTGNLKKLKILVPPVELQTQFVSRFNEIDSQKAQAQRSLKKSEELFNSLLQKAFNGELVK